MTWLQRLHTWIWPDDPVLEEEDFKALEFQHAEERWRQEQSDLREMEEVRQDLKEADTARIFLVDAKAELEARLSGIRRLSDIRRPYRRSE